MCFERAYPVIIPTSNGGAIVFGTTAADGGLWTTKYNVELYNALTNEFTVLTTTLFEEEIDKWKVNAPSSSYHADLSKMSDGKYVVLIEFDLGMYKKIIRYC